MNTTSPFLLVKQLEGDVLRLFSNIDIADLNNAEQQAVIRLKNALVDARLEIQDYELAETRDLQVTNAKNARLYLDTIQVLILANPSNVLGAVDVAHLTAYIGQITDNLR